MLEHFFRVIILSILALVLPVMGHRLALTQITMILVKKYGSYIIAKKIFNAQGIKNRLFAILPKRHIDPCYDQYKNIRGVSQLFLLDFWVTLIIIGCGKKIFLADVEHGISIELAFLIGIKAVVWELPLIFYLVFVMFNKINFSNQYSRIKRAETDLLGATKMLSKLQNKTLSAKDISMKEEYLRIVRYKKYRLKKVHEEYTFVEYDGNPY